MRQNENRINFHSLQTTTIFGPRYIDIEIEFKKNSDLKNQRFSDRNFFKYFKKNLQKKFPQKSSKKIDATKKNKNKKSGRKS